MALVEKGVLGKDVNVVGVVDISTDAKYFAYQLKYDSVHGTFRGDVKPKGEAIDMGRGAMPLTHERDASKLDWAKYGADIVLECTGKFLTPETRYPVDVGTQADPVTRGHLTQNLVSGGMAKCVVDLFEVVNIAKNE